MDAGVDRKNLKNGPFSHDLVTGDAFDGIVARFVPNRNHNNYSISVTKCNPTRLFSPICFCSS
jgi:hypothetical protein